MELMHHMSMYTLWHMSGTCSSIFMSSVKYNPRFFAVVDSDMILCPNERDVQSKFYVHLFGRIRRDSVFSSFNCYCFQSSNFYIRNACFHK